MIKYSGEIIDLTECDRITAIMIAEGKIFTSDCDHQDCFQQYCDYKGIESGFDWNDDENFDKIQAEAIIKTNELFKDNNEDFYGFDIFEGYDSQFYLTSHFPSNLEMCYDMIKQYANENECIIGTFFDSTYQIKLIEM